MNAIFWEDSGGDTLLSKMRRLW